MASNIDQQSGDQTDPQIALVDDSWRLIFSFFSIKKRAKLLQVSKKWREIIGHPSTWLRFETSLIIANSTRKLSSLAKFVTKYGTSICDLNLILSDQATLKSAVFGKLFDAIFQIKTLKRVAITHEYDEENSDSESESEGNPLIYSPKTQPACKDLKVLILDVEISKSSLTGFLSALPNLEELYCAQSLTCQWNEISLPKLQRIGLVTFSEEIMTACPSLKYGVTDSPKSSDTKRIKNTLFVPKKCFDISEFSSLENVKNIGPLLTPYSLLTKLITSYGKTRAAIKYLVKELHFDINSRGLKPKYTYRPSFYSHNIQSVTAYPLENALFLCKTQEVQELIELGARVECPLPNRSFLVAAQYLDALLLLLKHGADPSKIVGNTPAPAYMHVLVLLSQDAPQFIEEIKDRCDFNAHLLDGKSALEIAAEKKKWKTFEALVDAGAKQTPRALRSLIIADANRFQSLMKSEKIDLEAIDFDLAAFMVKKGMTHIIKERLVALSKEKDGNGWTLLHHYVASNDAPQKEFIQKNAAQAKEYRWRVVDTPSKAKLFDYRPTLFANTRDSSLRYPSKGRPQKRVESSSSSSSSSSSDDENAFESEKIARDVKPTPPQKIDRVVRAARASSESSDESSSESEKIVKHVKRVNNAFRAAPQKVGGFVKRARASSSSSSSSSSDNESSSESEKIIKGAMPTPPPKKLANEVKATRASSSSSSSSSSEEEFEMAKEIVPQQPLSTFQFSFNTNANNNNTNNNNTNQPQVFFGFATPHHHDSTFSSHTTPAIQPSSFSFGSLSLPASSQNPFAFNPSPTTYPTPSLTLAANQNPFAFNPPPFDLSSIKKPQQQQDFKEQKKYTQTTLTQSTNYGATETIELLGVGVNEPTLNGETPLLIACKAVLSVEQRGDRITALLNKGADVNKADKNGWTPLHASCYSKEWDIAMELLKRKADINAKDKNGITPLMAAFYGIAHSDGISKPMWHLFSPNLDYSATEKTTNRTLLHVMACVSTVNIPQLVLEKFDVNARDVEGFTPLHYALMYDNDSLAAELIQRGADVNAQSYALKMTPAMLLIRMMNPLAADGLYIQTVNTLMSSKRFKTLINTLHLARSHSTLGLLLSKSDLECTDSLGNSYLHLIVKQQGTPNFDEIKMYPLLSTQWGRKNIYNNTPFLSLCQSHLQYAKRTHKQLYSIAEQASQYGIDLNARDAQGKTVLEYVMDSDLPYKYQQRWLTLPGLKLRENASQYSSNLLIKAVLDDQVIDELIPVFILQEPNIVNDRDSNGRTLLMHVLESATQYASYMNTVDNILTCGELTDVNIQDNSGDTALHIACRFFHLGLVDSIHGYMNNIDDASVFSLAAFKLLDAGADPKIKNNRGDTPLDYVPQLIEHYQSIYLQWLKNFHFSSHVKNSGFGQTDRKVKLHGQQ